MQLSRGPGPPKPVETVELLLGLCWRLGVFCVPEWDRSIQTHEEEPDAGCICQLGRFANVGAGDGRAAFCLRGRRLPVVP